jgi:hypothetical protein
LQRFLSPQERKNQMQMAKQLSVTLANKPGRLSAMLAALNKEKVTCRALSVMDSGERGTVRFVPDNFAAAAKILEKINVRSDSADVLLVEVPNQMGAFEKICERLAADHLNIDYAYCSFNSAGAARGAKTGVLAVVKVNDLAKAQRVLGENGAAARTARRKAPVRRPVFAR